MQKWRKVQLIVLFILTIIGGLIGFTMTKSGIGEMKVLANIDVYSMFMLTMLIVMIATLAFDILSMYKSKKQFGAAKFKVILKRRKTLRNVLIFLVLDTVFQFVMFFASPNMHALPLCFMMLILTLMFIIHYRIDDGIGENGILCYGKYYNWDYIKSYSIGNDALLEMNILIKSLGFKYCNRAEFDFDRECKDDIESFLEEKYKF